MRREKAIVIDLFCGAGGESQGIHWAMGDGVKLFAVNHWQRACETHAESFPDGYRFTGTKADVVKQIGNAVCPKMAEALVRS